jgi:ribosomal protein S18 acetylase RimI-like enzyme
MIKPVTENDLHDCLKIFHRGYETVAVEFGLTEENCPDRGRASLPYEKLLNQFECGTLMFAYFHNDEPVGFLAMKMIDDDVCGLDDIVVLPEYRHRGYGKKLLDYCKQKAKELGSYKIRLGMIDDNKSLKKWYEDNGFVNIGYKNYDGAPFTVGKMECVL